MPGSPPRGIRRRDERPGAPGDGPDRGEDGPLRAAYRTEGASPNNRKGLPPPAVALLPGEKVGRICTVSAGAVSLRATFSGAPGEPVPPPVLPDPGPNVVCGPLREEGGAEERFFSCEVRSARPGDLAVATDELLRALSAHAALTGAVFEARIVRLAEPLVPDAFLVGELARDLSSHGIGVSFGPSSVRAPYGAAICVGASGRERRIERFLREHPAWQPIPL